MGCLPDARYIEGLCREYRGPQLQVFYKVCGPLNNPPNSPRVGSLDYSSCSVGESEIEGQECRDEPFGVGMKL